MFMPTGPVELLFVLFKDDFINFRKKNTLKWKLEPFPTIHTQKALKRLSTLQTPLTSPKLQVRMLKIDKIQEFAKRDKFSAFGNLNANHAHPDTTAKRQMITYFFTGLFMMKRVDFKS